MTSSTASDVLGTFGAVAWSIQLIPQIVLNYRRHNTVGLQPSMMLLWAFAGVPLGMYNILSRKSVALQIQAQILTVLSLVTWSQCMYYGHKWSISKAAAVVCAIATAAGGVEVAVVLGLRAGYHNDVPTGWLTALAVLAASGLGLGVLRHYWDIYTHRSVRGISFLFVGLDAAGDVFSLASVAVVKPLDVEGAAIYSVELGLWIGIMLAGVVFNLRDWLHRSSPSSHPADATAADDDALSTHSASSVFQTSAVTRLRHRVAHALPLQTR